MVDFPEFPHVQGVKCVCRDCGALCTPEGWTDRGGLCPRCFNPSRTKAPAPEPDPIRDAIDRAAAHWAKDNPKDPT